MTEPSPTPALTATGRVLDTAARVIAAVVPALIIAFLALCTTTGLVDRYLPSGEYTLLLRRWGQEPWILTGIFLACAAVYTLIFFGLRALVKRWTREPGEFVGRAAHRLHGAVDWLFARWWRVSLLLAVAWAPLYIMQFPGTSNADLVMQSLEVLGDRSQMNYPPFDVYPIGHYLIPNDEILLSNHHNVLLTLLYGHTLGASMALFGTYKVGFVLLTASQAAFTLLAFGRAMTLVGRHVPSRALRLTSLIVLVLCGLPIALWSIAIAKSPLFAAAFVWWLALSIDFALSRTRLSWKRILEWAVITFVVVASAKFALYIVVAQIVFLALIRRGKRPWAELAASIVAPVLIFQVILRLGISLDLVIPGDPLAGEGLQIQTTALALREAPEALTADEKAELDEVFDVEVMRDDFDQWTMGPIRGAGFREGAYRWRTVTEEQVERFDDIWLQIVRKEPLVVADGLILKSFRFFDPLAEGRDNRPGIHADDKISGILIDGDRLSDDGTNDYLRQRMDDLTLFVMRSPILHFGLESSLRVAFVLMLAAVAISLRRPGTWVWALPIALHSGVLMLGGLSSSGRYALGITYALPLVILALGAVRPRVRRTPRDEATDADADAAAPVEQGPR